MSMQQILVVMQGASGAGKSWLVHNVIAPLLRSLGYRVVVCSTDDLFNVNGFYKFDPKLLGKHHAENVRLAYQALKDGYSVIVDNTNTQCWEAWPYVSKAVEMGIPVHFHRATGNYQNTHGVPADKVSQMKGRLEELTVEAVMATKGKRPQQ